MASAMMQGLMKAGKNTAGGFARGAAPQDKKRVVPLNELPAEGDEATEKDEAASPSRRTSASERAMEAARRSTIIKRESAKTFVVKIHNKELGPSNDDNPDEAIKCVVRHRQSQREIFGFDGLEERMAEIQATRGKPRAKKEDDSAPTEVDEDELDPKLPFPMIHPTADWKIYWDLALPKLGLLAAERKAAMVRTRKQREAAPTPDKATKAPEEAPKQKKKSSKGGLTSYLNSSTLATCAAVAYVAFAYRNFSRVLDPLANLPDDYRGGVQVTPMWPENSTLDVEVALSTYASLPHDFMRNASLYDDSTVIIWREQNIELNTHTKDRKIDLRLCASESALQCSDAALAAAERAAQPGVLSRLILGEESSGPRQRIILPPKAWAQLQANGTLYLHSAVTRITEKARWRGLADNDVRRTARVPSIALVKFEAAPKGRAALAKRKLLYDVHPTLGSLGPPAPWAPTYTGEDGEMCAKWKPEAAVRVVAEFRDWPADVSVPGMQRFRDRAPGGSVVYKYAPPTYADEIGLTSDKYLVVNSTVDALPLSLNFQPLSFARWQLIARMEEGLKAQQEDFGFSENDIDEVRRLIADTKTWLLAVTMFASVLHLLFEFLAFKSDVDFWKNNKSLRGLSARSVVVDLISQIVVLAYLVDQGSSLLVSIPAAGAILIQCWKVEKATGVRPDFSRPFPWIRCERLEAVALSAKNAKADDKGAQLDAATLRVDRLATLYLSLSLGPLVVGYAVKTLIYDAHLGWYSWGLGAMTNAVYTGGFILMTPQLALNYHLKSVSHLPWRLLCFRFVNTFIDDLFAFVIKMPVMHRVSCFRDDVVFLIYLYQRRIYSVDMSRGVAGEDAAQ